MGVIRFIEGPAQATYSAPSPIALVVPATMSGVAPSPTLFLTDPIRPATQLAIAGTAAAQIATEDYPQANSNMRTFARGTAFEDQTITTMARVMLPSIGPAVQASGHESAPNIILRIYDISVKPAVEVQNFTALTAADLLFDSLQPDHRWVTDTTGYNFRHSYNPSLTTGSDASPSAHFDLLGNKVYRFEYSFLTDDDGYVFVISEVAIQNLLST